MHTYADDPYRIHHNGDFDGEIVLVYKRSDGDWTTYRTQSEDVLDLAKKYAAEPDKVLKFLGADCEGHPSEIAIPVGNLIDFVLDRYVGRALELLASGLTRKQSLLLLPLMGQLREILKTC